MTPEPSKFQTREKDSELQETIDAGRYAEYLLNRCRCYDSAATGALYAWQARERQILCKK